MTRLQLFVSDFTCCVFTFVLPGRTDATLKQFGRHKLEKKAAARDPLSDFIVNCW